MLFSNILSTQVSLTNPALGLHISDSPPMGTHSPLIFPTPWRWPEAPWLFHDAANTLCMQLPIFLLQRDFALESAKTRKVSSLCPKAGMKVKAAQSCLTLCNPIGNTIHGVFQARILEWAAFPFSRGSSQPRDRTQVSRIAGRFFKGKNAFPSQAKPKNTGVGSLSLLQQIFPTQELNQGL